MNVKNSTSTTTSEIPASMASWRHWWSHEEFDTSNSPCHRDDSNTVGAGDADVHDPWTIEAVCDPRTRGIFDQQHGEPMAWHLCSEASLRRPPRPSVDPSLEHQQQPADSCPAARRQTFVGNGIEALGVPLGGSGRRRPSSRNPHWLKVSNRRLLLFQSTRVSGPWAWSPLPHLRYPEHRTLQRSWGIPPPRPLPG
jgi:hypothetical protein